MGAMNATGHLIAVGSVGSVEALWDFLVELSSRYAAGRGEDRKMASPMVHGFPPALIEEVVSGGGPKAPRWCVHPSGLVEIECQDDDLSEALLKACVWLANELPSDELWRRDG